MLIPLIPVWCWYRWYQCDADTSMMLIPLIPVWCWYHWYQRDADTADTSVMLIPVRCWYQCDADTTDTSVMLVPLIPAWCWFHWYQHDADTTDSSMLLTPAWRTKHIKYPATKYTCFIMYINQYQKLRKVPACKTLLKHGLKGRKFEISYFVLTHTTHDIR